MKLDIPLECQRFKSRCVYSSAGLVLTWRKEHSFRFWTYMNLLSASLSLSLPIPIVFRALIICLGLLVLAAECFNTAIERVVNHLSPGPHPLAKAAKDAGSAGVAVTAFTAGVAWVFAVVVLFSA
ncbi:Diacylglycerol kinase [marine metagenome]